MKTDKGKGVDKIVKHRKKDILPHTMIVGHFDPCGGKKKEAEFPRGKEDKKILNKEFKRAGAQKITDPIDTPENIKKNQKRFKISEKEVNTRAEVITNNLIGGIWK